MTDKLYVYFIRDEETGLIKIGQSKQPKTRQISLQRQVKGKLNILCTIEDDLPLELRLHQRFASLRRRGEWFEANPELMSYIEEHAGRPDLTDEELSASHHKGGSTVVSVRLNSDNEMEKEAIAILEAWEGWGYSRREIFTKALIALGMPGDDPLERLDHIEYLIAESLDLAHLYMDSRRKEGEHD